MRSPARSSLDQPLRPEPLVGAAEPASEADGVDSEAAVNSEQEPASNALMTLEHTGAEPAWGGGRAKWQSPERQREAEEDRVLVLQAQQGDARAFRALVERHQRRAFLVAVGMVRHEQDARELVQEAFLRVFRNLDSFQGNSSFFTWLYRIITNLSIDLLRKPGRRDAELKPDQREIDESDDAEFPLLGRIGGTDPSEGVRRKELAQRLQIALDALPDYHRTVIVLREVEGMSYEEMAEAMQVSKGTIMSRLFHARQKLQRALANCYEEQFGARPPAVEGRTEESS